MSWKLRHQGSARQVPDLTLAQVVEGLQDGLWEMTDEVMGPGDTRWVPIESHPKLAETAFEIEEASKPIHHEEETHVDMVPLIDVTMVLLIFFILTISYQSLEKFLVMPKTRTDRVGTPVPQSTVEQMMIVVKARKGPDGRAQIMVENKPVPDEDQLIGFVSRYVRENRLKTEMVIDAVGVDWGTIVKIIDAATEANIRKVHFLHNAVR